MIDPKIIKERPEIIRKMLSDRHVSFDLDLMLSLDSKRREMITKTDDLRKLKNNMGGDIAAKKKSGQNAESLITEMQKVSQELQKLESDQVKTEQEFDKLVMTLPNLIHESVPIGIDDSANVVIKNWGVVPKFDFVIKDHIDISREIGRAHV